MRRGATLLWPVFEKGVQLPGVPTADEMALLECSWTLDAET